MLDFVNRLADSFVELHGDRHLKDDLALVAGPALFRGRSVMILGHQKGRNTRENLDRNFGMVRPEGYRKALRLIRQATKFRLPIITFIDTPGADPGPTSEERGQAIAIAECIYALAEHPAPIVSVVIGEGGSGGALAIGVADRIIMLENAVYSVASPEASASILWKDSSQAPAAAAAMGITADDLLRYNLIDGIVTEAVSANEDPETVIALTGHSIERHLIELAEIARTSEAGARAIRANRHERYRSIGYWQEA